MGSTLDIIGDDFFLWGAPVSSGLSFVQTPKWVDLSGDFHPALGLVVVFRFSIL